MTRDDPFFIQVYLVTVILILAAFLLPAVTVMTAVPGFFAAIVPVVLLTVSTFALLDVHTALGSWVGFSGS